MLRSSTRRTRLAEHSGTQLARNDNHGAHVHPCSRVSEHPTLTARSRLWQNPRSTEEPDMFMFHINTPSGPPAAVWSGFPPQTRTRCAPISSFADRLCAHRPESPPFASTLCCEMRAWSGKGVALGTQQGASALLCNPWPMGLRAPLDTQTRGDVALPVDPINQVQVSLRAPLLDHTPWPTLRGLHARKRQRPFHHRGACLLLRAHSVQSLRACSEERQK
jgi:hypothetical protein